MTAAPIQTAETAAIAAAFVAARLSRIALPGYPGDLPTAMSQSYAIQDQAIALFPDTIIGWKVGGVPPLQQPALGVHRLAAGAAVSAVGICPLVLSLSGAADTTTTAIAIG